MKNKKPPIDKQYSAHEQRDFVDLDGLPQMMTLPSLEQLGAIPKHYPTEPDNHLPAQINRLDVGTAVIQQNQPINPSQQVLQTAPPIPETGLPQGWTIEQWNYYGAQWLESRNS